MYFKVNSFLPSSSPEFFEVDLPSDFSVHMNEGLKQNMVHLIELLTAFPIHPQWEFRQQEHLQPAS